MDLLIDILLDAGKDTLSLAPFLLVTYLALETLEHVAGDRVNGAIKRAGAAGPVVGSLLGMVPQCGFSAMAATLSFAFIVFTMRGVFWAPMSEIGIPSSITGSAFLQRFPANTQLLIEGRNLSEDEIFDYITKNIEGDCLLAVGDESLIKIHFHTNTPWKVVEYAASLGEIYDIVIENMERQEQGLQG